jgi:LPPG:FO 2-phospho-L-lactate transferase
VSIGTILAVPGITDALRETVAPVVGVSPIISGAPVRGMADACLQANGIETSAAAVAMNYGPRSSGGLLDGWLVDESDGESVAIIEDAGIACRAVPLLMSDIERTAGMARASLDLAAQIG